MKRNLIITQYKSTAIQLNSPLVLSPHDLRNTKIPSSQSICPA
jgi:hypothetical protein